MDFVHNTSRLHDQAQRPMRQEHSKAVPDFAVLWLAPCSSKAQKPANKHVTESMDVP